MDRAISSARRAVRRNQLIEELRRIFADQAADRFDRELKSVVDRPGWIVFRECGEVSSRGSASGRPGMLRRDEHRHGSPRVAATLELMTILLHRSSWTAYLQSRKAPLTCTA
jgi:hypothetical protein